MKVGTHSGTFHADDVLAFALIQRFVDSDAEVVRTRDRGLLDTCDIVIDVGGEYSPEAMRFDHHQKSYQGPCSSAGMVLDWLASTARVDPGLADHLRARMVDYVDAVDTGREAPRLDVPCFARIVEALGNCAESADGQHDAFLKGAEVARLMLEGLELGYNAVCRAREAVLASMAHAEASGSSVIELDAYYAWKQPYFEAGGASHPTEYVLFPSDDSTWKIVAIPPRLGMFEQKRSLPSSWAGKMNGELEAATGVPGSIFCHKNRFIAVFSTREGAHEALARFDLHQPLPMVESVERSCHGATAAT